MSWRVAQIRPVLADTVDDAVCRCVVSFWETCLLLFVTRGEGSGRRSVWPRLFFIHRDTAHVEGNLLLRNLTLLLRGYVSGNSAFVFGRHQILMIPWESTVTAVDIDRMILCCGVGARLDGKKSESQLRALATPALMSSAAPTIWQSSVPYLAFLVITTDSTSTWVVC